MCFEMHYKQLAANHATHVHTINNDHLSPLKSLSNLPLDLESIVNDLNFKSRLDLNLNLTSLGCCRKSRCHGFHASSESWGSVQKWSGSSHIAASCSSQESPAAKSVQTIAGWGITVLHHCCKGRQSHKTSDDVHVSRSVALIQIGDKRHLVSSTSWAIFGPNFLLQLCPRSVSVSAGTAHVFSRQGALWSFPNVAV